MLKTVCIHPELMKLLAACGHGDKILIADGNYPIDSNTGGGCAKIYLNLTHGIPLVTDVLSVLEKTIPVEKAETMIPDSGEEPAIFSEFRSILNGLQPDYLGRFEFYEACKKENVKVAIATGEQRIYANILLTVGVV
ncbi:RbsD/FucU family protein [Paenibacillus alkalitolerans]|uniref:RbsD/FucU family protein n=1 Tax=Paenibacillus alkalitolerans TaxID=2799335 RepID=UPI0018F5C9B0|nr:RbsD/FucU family protein [Paenibacillus alkalitolerans]